MDAFPCASCPPNGLQHNITQRDALTVPCLKAGELSHRVNELDRSRDDMEHMVRACCRHLHAEAPSDCRLQVSNALNRSGAKGIDTKYQREIDELKRALAETEIKLKQEKDRSFDLEQELKHGGTPGGTVLPC